MNVARAICIGALLAHSAPAVAQTDPGLPTLRTSRYAVDMFQGPVLTSTRVNALSGAYVAIAEGVDGSTQNPAAPAVRTTYSFDHFDYDLGLGIVDVNLFRASPFSKVDFFNRGENTDLRKSAEQSFTAINLAFLLQFGQWGVGVAVDAQYFSLEDRTTLTGERRSQEPLTAGFLVGHIPQIAQTFDDGQIAVGGGLRTTGLTMSRGGTDLFTSNGIGFELGLLWRPNWQPFRVGAAFRNAISTQTNLSDPGAVGSDGSSRWLDFDEDGPGGVPSERLYLPDTVVLPWDLNFGVAVQLGPRPFNPRWLDPSDLARRSVRFFRWRARERARRRSYEMARIAAGASRAAAVAAIDAELATEAAIDELNLERTEARIAEQLRRRYRRLPRSHVLLSASMVVTGPVTRGVGVEGFLQQQLQQSGQNAVISPRLGAETEIIPNWLKLRGGTYLEPTRFETSTPRAHSTLGFEAKVLPWTVFGLYPDDNQWRISGFVDLANNYFSWGGSIGVWH